MTTTMPLEQEKVAVGGAEKPGNRRNIERHTTQAILKVCDGKWPGNAC